MSVSWDSLLLTLLPIVVMLLLLVVWKKPADFTGIIGWSLVSIIVLLPFLPFKTGLPVVLRSTLTGLIKSFPVSMIVAASLLQMAYMEKTGALKRIIIFIKTLASGNRAVQIMLINIGFGTLMVAVGATPVSLLPPILIAMGYSTYVAIAMPAIGYDSLCTYALLGAPIVVFVDIANKFFGPGNEITLSDAGKVFYLFLPIVSTLIGFSLLWIAGRWKGIKEGWLPCLITGATIAVVSFFTNRVENLVVLTGIFCGIAVILVMVLYLTLSGKKIIDKSKLTDEEREYEKKFPLWKAFTPWLLLIVIILALNLPKSSFNYLYKTLLLPINGLSPDGAPIRTRALWNPYTWIVVSIVLSFIFIRPTVSQLKDTVKVWWKRAPRPVFSAAIFFAIAEVMFISGFGTEGAENMVKVLADASAYAFKDAYGLIASFIGLFGGFLTGSEASAIVMFGNYTLMTAKQLNYFGVGTIGAILVTAAMAFGGGLASVISPAKLQNAAASIDKLGEEGKVIRVAFIFSVTLTLVTAIFAFILIKTGVFL